MRISSCNSSITIKFAVNMASAKNRMWAVAEALAIAVAVLIFGSCNDLVNYEDRYL